MSDKIEEAGCPKCSHYSLPQHCNARVESIQSMIDFDTPSFCQHYIPRSCGNCLHNLPVTSPAKDLCSNCNDAKSNWQPRPMMKQYDCRKCQSFEHDGGDDYCMLGGIQTKINGDYVFEVAPEGEKVNCFKLKPAAPAPEIEKTHCPFNWEQGNHTCPSNSKCGTLPECKAPLKQYESCNYYKELKEKSSSPTDDDEYYPCADCDDWSFFRAIPKQNKESEKMYHCEKCGNEFALLEDVKYCPYCKAECGTVVEKPVKAEVEHKCENCKWGHAPHCRDIIGECRGNNKWEPMGGAVEPLVVTMPVENYSQLHKELGLLQREKGDLAAKNKALETESEFLAENVARVNSLNEDLEKKILKLARRGIPWKCRKCIAQGYQSMENWPCVHWYEHKCQYTADNTPAKVKVSKADKHKRRQCLDRKVCGKTAGKNCLATSCNCFSQRPISIWKLRIQKIAFDQRRAKNQERAELEDYLRKGGVIS